MAFNFVIHHFYYWFRRFSGHLNRHNNDFQFYVTHTSTRPIISTYSRCSENECLILIRHYYSSVQFIYASISHIFNFINCYGVYFDLIGFIKFQCLIRFYFISLEIKIKIQHYVCSILHLLEFEFAFFFFFHILRQFFFSARTMAPFYRYYR